MVLVWSFFAENLSFVMANSTLRDNIATSGRKALDWKHVFPGCLDPQSCSCVCAGHITLQVVAGITASIQVSDLTFTGAMLRNGPPSGALIDASPETLLRGTCPFFHACVLAPQRRCS